ncbi:hypothetical protein D9758_005253 [Tetrapyrgos nigripes]|uniref:Uncharacterized protein n=1 Tax=Tetrapyrgos nigripes TaxID=182062 RepID=A0A8H5GWT5_9AGAR|nr:hypothetical protein D9758_005253 [Tetrapyrgos nigripes]
MMALMQLLKDSLVRTKKEGGTDTDTPSGTGTGTGTGTTTPFSSTKPNEDTGEATTPTPTPTPPPAYTSPSSSISVLRLIELTDRTSAVMKSFSSNLLSTEFDPLLTIYRTFTNLTLNDLGLCDGGVQWQGKVSVEAWDEMASAVADYAMDVAAEREMQMQMVSSGFGGGGGGMVLVPWAMRLRHGGGGDAGFVTIPPTPAATSNPTTPGTAGAHVSHNRFDALFKSANTSGGG